MSLKPCARLDDASPKLSSLRKSVIFGRLEAVALLLGEDILVVR